VLCAGRVEEVTGVGIYECKLKYKNSAWA
jgi:hypothetical protein